MTKDTKWWNNASMVGILIGEKDQRKVLLCRTKKNPEFWQPIGGSQQMVEPIGNVFDNPNYVPEPPEPEPADWTATREIREEVGLFGGNYEALRKICTYPSKAGGEVTFFKTSVITNDVSTVSSMMENNAKRCDEIEDAKWVYLSEAVDLPTMVATKAFLWQLRHKLLQEDVKSACKGIMELTKEISHD